MKARLFWILVFVGVILAVLGYRGCLRFRAGLDEAFTKDAVLCISMGVSNIYLENPAATSADVEARLRLLHDASITHVVLDPAGKPVDLYGTPFQVRREVKGNQQTVTATSAGPDRRFGTGDDIIHATTDELRPPRKS